MNLVVGFPGHGKSTLVGNLVFASRDRNALIYQEGLDIGADAYKKFPETSFWKYKGGKVVINAEEVKYKLFLEHVKKNFRNGTLVIDEGGLYEQDILTDEMKAIAALRRKIGVDIFINYHGVSDLPIRQYQYVNNLILFHSADNFSYKATKVPKIKEMLAAKERIAAQVAKGNKYYHEVIRLS